MDENKNYDMPSEDVEADEEAPSKTCECGKEGKKKCKKSDTGACEKEIEELKAERDRLIAEAKEKDDKYLRMAAEYDNFRRRSREEKEATYGNAEAATVKELLPIIDNLERAAAYDDSEKVKEGLKMIASSVTATLAKLGVEEYGKVGDVFDPNIHNAVLHEEDDSGREGEISEVFQKGYRKGARIIRFAMVKTVN